MTKLWSLVHHLMARIYNKYKQYLIFIMLEFIITHVLDKHNTYIIHDVDIKKLHINYELFSF